MKLYDDIKFIKGVGPKMGEELNKIGIFNILDLLLYFPRDYDNINGVNDITLTKEKEKVIIKGKVVQILRDVRSSKGKVLSTVTFYDGKNKFYVKWFNQPYIKQSFKIGAEYVLSGKVEIFKGSYTLNSPRVIRNSTLDKENIIAKYPLKGKITNTFLNKTISNILGEIEIEENLPERLVKKYKLCSLREALHSIHSPSDFEALNQSTRRLKFQELFSYSLKILMLKEYIEESKNGVAFKVAKELEELKKQLPFTLTTAQCRVLREILLDQKKPKPMNRLVQGDVGSGKTIVAIIVLFNVVKNGYQGAIMAPTEILAKQHYIEICNILKDFNIRVELLVGSTTKKNKDIIKEKLEKGEIDIIVGTHALIEENVVFSKLGLVITDEQHRFGVNQRCRFYSKGDNIDVLVMTATPIPRTLSLYLYGDLEVSIIDELPPGRQNIETFHINKNQRENTYNFAREEIAKGRQVYVVCPLVEENEKLSIVSVEELYEELKEGCFKDLEVKILHGKMKAKEKEAVMEDFKCGNTKVLISTTVIEVGVNVPNATLMVIENAERFGLAQLHQLRGRVGRGSHKSYCILVSEGKSKVTEKRMEIMSRSTDGFLISEEDLKIRGAGEIFGFKQSGENELILSDIVEDFNILKVANKEAKELLHSKKEEDVKVKEEILGKIHKSSNYICYN